MTIAVTGATGFVGGRLLEVLKAKGIPARALARRPQEPRDGIEWIEGSLADPDSLARLVKGAEAVIHVAGAVSAPSRQAFEAANVEGTRAVVEAATQAGVRRFVHVSSLAARHPSLSLYGASKAGAEDVVAASGLDWTMVRPPAVFGPGDRELLEMFRMAKLGLVLLPPGGRLSLIHADDLARLLATLAAANDAPPIMEPDDARPGGWTHREFAQAISRAVEKRGLAFHTPQPLLRAGAAVDRLVRRDKAKLTADRVAYFCHPDWVSDPALKPPAELWRPLIPTPEGLAGTAAWYRERGWL